MVSLFTGYCANTEKEQCKVLKFTSVLDYLAHTNTWY